MSFAELSSRADVGQPVNYTDEGVKTRCFAKVRGVRCAVLHIRGAPRGASWARPVQTAESAECT